MAWTTPKTWSSEPLTSVDLNTYIRDNQNHVKDRLDTASTHELNQGSDYTTTSATFTDVDGIGTELELTITTHGGDVLCWFLGSTTNTSSGGYYTYWDVLVDGVRWAGDDGITVTRYNGTGDPTTHGFMILITGLSAGSHTFKLQWKTSNGTAKLWAGAGTSNFDLHPQFGVKEV